MTRMRKRAREAELKRSQLEYIESSKGAMEANSYGTERRNYEQERKQFVKKR